MQKKAMKNFVYSFLFSLSVTAVIGRVCFTEPKNKNPNLNINTAESTNISLFSKPADVIKIRKHDRVDTSAIDALTQVEAQNTDTKIFSDDILPSNHSSTVTAENSTDKLENIEIVDTSLDNSSEIILPEKTPVVRENNELNYEKSGIVYAEQEEAPLNKALNYEKSGIVYADISDTLHDEKAQSVNDESKVYTDTFGTDNSENIVAIATNTSPEIEMAYNDDIPLTESSGTLHASIDVSQTAQASEIAMLEPDHLVSTIEEIDEEPEKTLAEADLKQNEWTQMSETKEDSPWVIAKGNKFAKNKIVVEQFADKHDVTPQKKENQIAEENELVANALNPKQITDNGASETKLAYQMIPNLLIPIPEDIANDPNLTPQLSVDPQNKTKEDKPVVVVKSDTQDKSDALNEKDRESGLFKSITSWFAGNDNKSADDNSKTKKNERGFSFFGRNTAPSEENNSKKQILPAELRLSFQPNRAEISGQTLRWIHAFADNVLANNDMYIEVRIDGTSSFALQKKRLNLLSTIFANRGVDFRKINIVFTSREPNSFIIRNIRFNNNEEVVVNKNSENTYYRPW